jgi:hypothetical protein
LSPLDTYRRPLTSNSFANHANILVGVQNDSMTACIHVGKLPPRTLAVLERSTSELYPDSPLRLSFVHAVPEIFTIYHTFLYEGVLFSHHADIDQDFEDNGQAVTHEDAEWSRLAQSYLLGLRLEDEKFYNTIIDGLVKKFSEVVSLASLGLTHWLVHANAEHRTATRPASPPKSTR